MFQFDVIVLYISALGHASLNSVVVFIWYLKKMFHYHHALVILRSVLHVYIFENEHLISALEHVRMPKLSSYVILACINTIYKYCHAWVI